MFSAWSLSYHVLVSVPPSCEVVGAPKICFPLCFLFLRFPSFLCYFSPFPAPFSFMAWFHVVPHVLPFLQTPTMLFLGRHAPRLTLRLCTPCLHFQTRLVWGSFCNPPSRSPQSPLDVRCFSQPERFILSIFPFYILTQLEPSYDDFYEGVLLSRNLSRL